jgi:hypothetical protein
MAVGGTVSLGSGLQLEFRADENKALLPWRERRVSLPQVAAAVAGILAIGVAGWLLEGGDIVHLAWSLVALAFVIPGVFYLRGWIFPPRTTIPAIALDAQGIVAPDMAYINWESVHTIAHAHVVGWGFRPPIAFDLLLFPKRGQPKRISLPDLTADEREQLFEILRRIARLHKIDFVLDHTHEGARKLKRLPLVWF